MRVILDECLPRRLGLALDGHSVSTVQQAGWAGIANGELLARIQGTYDAFITIDKDLAAQQMTTNLSFGVLVLRAPSNKLDDVKPLVPQILAALSLLQPGQVVLLPAA
jgi:predicted nuclease of predicted toxin-antitoxin system